jgi:Arylsulfotransferase (ASST)
MRSTRRKPLHRSALVGVAALLVGLCLEGCGSGTPLLTAFPIPGGRVASPQTQIAFRGVPAGRLGRVTVTGSRSGRHAGRLVPDSDRRGGSFLPDRPFLPGEVVTVRTGLHIRGARRGTFRFTVASPAGAVPAMPLPPASRVPGDELSFQSRPDLTPASIEVTNPSPGAASGDVFITPQQGPTQNGAMILDASGGLVWFQPVPAGDMAADLRVQRLGGRPVLTWWQGYSGAGIGAGEDVIEDESYRRVAVVRAANGLSADLHEFRLTPRGTALITAYYPVYWNASAVHGSSRQIVFDSVVQEIDVKTGLVLYQWDSLDHVPLADSYEPMPSAAGQPFDYFHINSIQPEKDGDLLISARNTWAAYEIDRHTGRVVWSLGGKRSSFRLGPGVQFAFQHDVRLHADPDPTVTLFDDGAGGGGGGTQIHAQSRGIRVRLNRARKTATLVSEDVHTPALTASFEGNMQELPDGDEFLGWGQEPYFTEYDPRGRVVFDGRFVGPNSSYRAYRFRWTGKPRSAPAVRAAASAGNVDVYVSWNGATNVTSWRVLGGGRTNGLHALVTAPKDGFETQIVIFPQRYVAVQALDGAGRVLATSATVRVH